MSKAFSSEPSGIVVNKEKYIFIRNEGGFAVFRKVADGMTVVKLNQAYIVSIGINQKPEILVGKTNKIAEYLKSCGY